MVPLTAEGGGCPSPRVLTDKEISVFSKHDKMGSDLYKNLDVAPSAMTVWAECFFSAMCWLAIGMAAAVAAGVLTRWVCILFMFGWRWAVGVPT